MVLAPEELEDLIREQGVTTLFLTTALFKAYAVDAPRAFERLRYLLFGGEAADPTKGSRCVAVGRFGCLLHVYGPTESTTFATWHLVCEVPEGATTVPIGRPIANTTAYVLDELLRLVPVGVPGELYLGGDGLVRATSRRRTPRPRNSSRTHSPARDTGSTGLAIACSSVLTGQSSSSVEWTIRSRSEASASSPGRSRRWCGVIQRLPRHRSSVREDAPGQRSLLAYVVARSGQTVSAGDLAPGALALLPDARCPRGSCR